MTLSSIRKARKEKQKREMGEERESVHGPVGFWDALVGLWRLTWKRRLTPARAATTGLLLMALPVLFYVALLKANTNQFWALLFEFYFFLILPLTCLLQFGGMIRDELQSDTLVFLLTRPLSRGRFYITQYLCVTLWLQTVLLVQLGLVTISGILHGVQGLWSGMIVVLGVQILAVFGWGAISSFLGLLAKRYLVLGLLYGFVVEIGIGKIPTNINNLSLSRHFRTLLQQETSFRQWLGELPQSPWFSLLLVIVAVAIFVLAGAMLFTFREYHSNEEMQK